MAQIDYYAPQVNSLLAKAGTAVQPETTGDLADLTTENKDNLVTAINEVKASAGGEYAERAEAAAEAAEEVLESIPEDYSELSDEVSDLRSAFGDYYISVFQQHNGIMNSAGTSWMNINDSYQHIVIPVTAGQYFNIIHSNEDSMFAFLKSYSGTSSAPQLSSETGYDRRFSSSTTGRTGMVPSDANYLWLAVIINGTPNLPTKLEIGGWDYMKTVIGRDKALVTSIENVLPTIAELSRNVFDKDACTDGYYVAPDTGNRTPNENYFITDYMSIEYGKYLLFSRNGAALNARWFALYDENKTVIPYASDVHANMSSYFIVDKKAKYCRATFAISLNKANMQVELSDTNSPTALVPYGWHIQENNMPISSLFGKKVAWYGDSIAQTNWWNDVNKYFGFKSTNCGVGGTTITNSGSNPAAMCEKTRMQGEYPAQTDPNTGTVTQPVAIPNDTEIIFICGGTNDWLNNMETGGEDFRKYPGVNSSGEYKLFRFYSACHYMFKNMMELFPNAKIIVCGTPFGQYPNRFSPTYSNGILNNVGMTSIDYEDAFCDIAGLWGIPCIRYGRNMQINAENVATLLDPAAASHLHPTTDAAKKIFSNTVISWLKSHYC